MRARIAVTLVGGEMVVFINEDYSPAAVQSYIEMGLYQMEGDTLSVTPPHRIHHIQVDLLPDVVAPLTTADVLDKVQQTPEFAEEVERIEAARQPVPDEPKPQRRGKK